MDGRLLQFLKIKIALGCTPGTMAAVLYAVLFCLLHTVYGLCKYICTLVQTAPYRIRCLNDVLPSLDRYRKPTHLAVVFVWETHQTALGESPTHMRQQVHKAMLDVYRLVEWCAAAGIAELSVYDEQGLLREAAQALSPSASPALMDVHMGLDTQGQYPPPFAYSPSPSALCDKALHQPHVRVNVLSARDDKPALVQAVNTLPTIPITSSHISSALRHAGAMATEPDVLMVCDPCIRPPELHGFPCWCLRLTTIGSLPSWAHTREWMPTHFLDTLRLYTMAEQRHGA